MGPSLGGCGQCLSLTLIDIRCHYGCMTSTAHTSRVAARIAARAQYDIDAVAHCASIGCERTHRRAKRNLALAAWLDARAEVIRAEWLVETATEVSGYWASVDLLLECEEEERAARGRLACWGRRP